MAIKNSYITATDQFCGAGGSTDGATEAGVEVKLALNHWDLAIKTHNTNFPDTAHDCTDISACDPRRYPSTHILITSPECTNHGLAKGKRRKNLNQGQLFDSFKIDPAEERSRATMWDVPRFAEFHQYEVIIVENVVEARLWVTWDAWLKAMHLLGYNHKCVYLNSMFFYPCPQSRDRIYVVFWKKGNKAPDLEYNPNAWCNNCEKNVLAFQSWKNSAKPYGKYGERNQYLYRCPKCTSVVTPYHFAAFNCIDWSIKGERIGDRSTPLSENTMRRITKGVEKYGNKRLLFSRETNVFETGNPFFTYAEHAKQTIISDSSDSIRTQNTRQTAGLVMYPFLMLNGDTSRERVYGMEHPLPTQSTFQNYNLVVPPFITELNSTGTAREITEPLSTVLAGGNHHGFLIPMVVENMGQSNSRSVLERLATQTANTKFGLVTDANLHSFISYYYGGSDIASHITEAANTCRTTDSMALINYESEINIDDCLYRILKPHEIQRAMAFRDNYVILGSQKNKVKQLGNAVTPPVMKWLVKQCVDSLET